MVAHLERIDRLDTGRVGAGLVPARLECAEEFIEAQQFAQANCQRARQGAPGQAAYKLRSAALTS
ncbi:MAG: hypothetical protein OXI55_02845 [Gammaproteobacteria bacterium]|nr:hypothetical protein [Gammaproteobacteria bacterium]